MNEEYVLEADKKKPYKTIAAMVSAFLSSLLLSGVPLNPVIQALLGGIIAALAVYLVPNPLKVKQGRRHVNVNDDPALW